MAFNLAAGGGRRSRGMPAMAEINVTPFVDVALVLLIIFMITAHVMESGVEVQVPKTKSVATSAKDLPVVTLTPTGDTYLGNVATPLSHMVDEIHSRYPGQNAVYVRADRTTPWDPIMQVSSALGAAKFAINYVTQPYSSGTRR